MANLKITNEQLVQFRHAYAAGQVTFLEIRKVTGVSKTALEQLLTGRLRGHIGGPLAVSFAGVETLFPAEKKRDAWWRKDYQHTYNKKRRDLHIQRAFDLLGGRKCRRCGATENLQFDHIDPATKKFEIGNQAGRAWEQVRDEVRKCQVLCYACHKKKSARESAAWLAKHFSGENGSQAKLTNDEVKGLRERYAAGKVTITGLAAQLEMAPKVVRQMLRGGTYANAGGPLASPDESINYITPERKQEYRAEVIELYRGGMTRLSDICRRVPVASHTAKAYLVAEGLLAEGPKPKDNQPHARLTLEEARGYRERFARGGVSRSELARAAGMSLPGMIRLLRGQSYRSAGGPLIDQ